MSLRRVVGGDGGRRALGMQRGQLRAIDGALRVLEYLLVRTRVCSGCSEVCSAELNYVQTILCMRWLRAEKDEEEEERDALIKSSKTRSLKPCV